MKRTMVKIHDLEWFQNHPTAYKDSSGDWWEKAEQYRHWLGCAFSDSDWIQEFNVGGVIDIKDYPDGIKWGIEKILPEDEYPEYYL
jgi:hypothetical protein